MNYSYLRPPNRMVRGRISNGVERFSQGSEQLSGRSRKLTTEQMEDIKKMRQYLLGKNRNKQIDDNILLRYYHLNDTGSITQTINQYQRYQKWMEMPPISRNKERQILNSGAFYCYGRDDDYSPNIYFNPSLINLSNFTLEEYFVSLRTLLKPVQQHMLIQDKITKWNVVIDAKTFNQAKFKNNYQYYFDAIKNICDTYPQRLKYIFLLLPVPSGIWSMISSSQNSLPATTRMIKDLSLQNNCIKISNINELDRYIKLDERQRKYGGNQQNLSEYWPIVSTNRLMEVNSRFIQGSEDSPTYNSVANDAQFFGEKQENSTRCKCSIQ